jgi:chemotaxis protein MotB
MSKGKCHCKKHAECEECPEWIFTFADLVMLMMGFFVILWVLKPAPGKNNQESSNPEYVEVAAAIREAFGYVPNPASSDPIDRAILDKINHVTMNGPGEKGKANVPDISAQGTDDEVTNIRTARQATTGAPVMFDAGSANLRPDAMKALNEIAEQIRGHRNIVLVKGHAALDDTPPDANGAAARMQLSIRRAQVVADYLASKGVAPEVLRVQGCSTFEPIAQRIYSLAGQAANRRVEVEATPQVVEQYDGTPTTQPTNELNLTPAAPATHAATTSGANEPDDPGASPTNPAPTTPTNPQQP